MNFDPNNFDPNSYDGGGGDYGEQELLPAGHYVCWVKLYKRKESRGKSQILLVVIPVLTAKGDRIPDNKYSAIFETVTLTAKAAWRLAELCKALGQREPFNVNSDRELSAAVKFKPFLAAVKHETWQGNTSARIDQYLSLPENLRRAAEEMLDDQAVDRAASGDGYGSHPGNGGYGSDYSNAPSHDDFSDDDIPF